MSLSTRIVGTIAVLAVIVYIAWSGGTKIVAARQTLEDTKKTVVVLNQIVVSQADRLLSMEKTVDLLVDLQATVDQCQVRAEYVEWLANERQSLGECCDAFTADTDLMPLLPPMPEVSALDLLFEQLAPHPPGLKCDKYGCTKLPSPTRLAPEDLLPQDIGTLGGIAPMMQFMKGQPAAPQVEVPSRPPTAAELRRDKGSAVVP